LRRLPHYWAARICVPTEIVQEEVDNCESMLGTMKMEGSRAWADFASVQGGTATVCTYTRCSHLQKGIRKHRQTYRMYKKAALEIHEIFYEVP
jgi:hypothetical protein